MGKKSTGANVYLAEEELHGAARSGDLKAVQQICSANPLAINSRDRHSRTPLHLAAWSGHAEVVNYLCKNKADVGAAAMDDMGAIHFAAQKGHLEVMKILCTHGVSIKSYNRKGMTALHYAALGSYIEIVKYLVKKGANVDAKNKAGKTAVHLASSEAVQNFLAEGKMQSSKAALTGDEESDKPEPNPLSEETEHRLKDDDDDALAGDLTSEKENEETLKREPDDEAIQCQPKSKKFKVSLNHLLATDDTQEDEENV